MLFWHFFSPQYEVLGFALLDPSYLIVASGSHDVKVTILITSNRPLSSLYELHFLSL